MDRTLPEPLFTRLLGPAFERLPAPLKCVHGGCAARSFDGEVWVRAPLGFAARAIARLLGFPLHAARVPVTVRIVPEGDGERWERGFPPRPMCTRLRACDGGVQERFGPLVVHFGLRVEDAGITWQAQAARLLGVPLPRAWLVGMQARAAVEEGRYRFAVRGSLPGLGYLLDYEGWLGTSADAVAVGPSPACFDERSVRVR